MWNSVFRSLDLQKLGTFFLLLTCDISLGNAKSYFHTYHTWIWQALLWLFLLDSPIRNITPSRWVPKTGLRHVSSSKSTLQSVTIFGIKQHVIDISVANCRYFHLKTENSYNALFRLLLDIFVIQGLVTEYPKLETLKMTPITIFTYTEVVNVHIWKITK